MAAFSLWRVVEHQNRIYEYNATSTESRAERLKRLIEKTKPEPYFYDWHELIASQFRYPLPVALAYQARFRPPGSMKNVFYASQEIQTCLAEHAYYFMRLRRGLKKVKETGQRTLFSTKFVKGVRVTDLTSHPRIQQMTDPNDYSASHQYVNENSQVTVIQYPSCRDPERRPNFAVREIKALEKTIEREKTISFAFDRKKETMYWIEENYRVSFSEARKK